ncbi:hypothetical protein B0H11DRAFT_1701179 [Mycena galericulata]|nr:hypothetical protein B0H11DRAFT_1701179 [Mycena galericulata]
MDGTRHNLQTSSASFYSHHYSDPKLIVDAEGRIIAVLLGAPEDPDWDNVVNEALKAMHGWYPSPHRRGLYLPLTTGVSFGGGQKRPGNLVNCRLYRRLIRSLLRNKAIQRLAGFQSSGLAMYVPKLYRYYRRILKALFEQNPELVHNFRNSIFPAATFNCGPDAVTFDHVDFLNLAHGLCAITCAGNFDPTTGGQVHLRQLRLVLQCPSGASLLIPSGCLDHGNTPIQRGETRHSMTQYAAGGLFRWVTYGFRSAKSLLAQPGGREARDAFDGTPGSRWRWAVDLFSKYDELAADRAGTLPV